MKNCAVASPAIGVSHRRAPPSIAAKIAPTAPIPRPAMRSTRTPASVSARSVPAWYAPSAPVPVSTRAVRRSGEYGVRRSGSGDVMNGDQLQDFEAALAVRCHDIDLVALFLADQGTADGRRRGDEAFLDVGVFRHDELEDFGHGGLSQVQRRSESDAVLWQLVEVDHLQIAD